MSPNNEDLKEAARKYATAVNANDAQKNYLAKAMINDNSITAQFVCCRNATSDEGRC